MLFLILRNPPPRHQHGAPVRSLQRRNNLVPVIALPDPRANQHFLVVSEAPSCEDATVVELLDVGCVDVGREGKWGTDETVFVFVYEGGFPFETLHLPGAEGEGG